MFVSKQQPSDVLTGSKLAEIQSQLGHDGNEYLFLRSIWKSHSHQYNHAVIDVDDQLDRLNKIVAMMKKHINYSVKKQLYYQNHHYQQGTSPKQSKLLQAVERANMESQQYRTRLAETKKLNQSLSKTNKDLNDQIYQLKKKQKQNESQIKQLTQKNALLKNKILQLGHEDSKSQKSIGKVSRIINKQPYDANNSTLESSISQCLHIPVVKKQKSQKLLKNRHLLRSVEQQSSLLNSTLMLDEENLDESFMSYSSYQFSQKPIQTLQKSKSHLYNKQNLQQSCYIEEHNETKIQNKPNTKPKFHKIQDSLKQSIKYPIKFVRQSSKTSLVVKRQKSTAQSTIKAI